MILLHGYVSPYLYLLLNLCLSYYVAEGVDPSAVGIILPEVNRTDPFCPSPMSFLRNTNSSTAVLMGDEVNGTQPEHAGVYTCYSNGLPRDTVEIIVLGILNFLAKYLLRYYTFDTLCLLQFLHRHHLFLRPSFAFQLYH